MQNPGSEADMGCIFPDGKSKIGCSQDESSRISQEDTKSLLFFCCILVLHPNVGMWFSATRMHILKSSCILDSLTGLLGGMAQVGIMACAFPE